MRNWLVAALLPACAHVYAQSPEPIDKQLPARVTVERDLVYAAYGKRSLKLDLYRPRERGDSRLATVVVIRGGGWLEGDKEAFGPMAAALAERGLAAASIEYRASPEAVFPAAVEDTKAAVVGLATPSDFAVLRGAGAAGNPLGAFLGASYDEAPDLWAAASPITHVGGASPPALLIHSEADDVVPFMQSLRLAQAFGAAGVPVELVLIPNAPHAFWNFRQWFGDTMDRAAVFFFRAHL